MAMKDSGIQWIGKIPENWEVKRTLYVLKMPITDGPHTTPDLYDDGIPFVSAEAVSAGNGKIDFSHIRGFISEEFYIECCKKYIPEINDIYMIKSGATTGKVSIVDTHDVFTIWSPLAVFRCDENKMLPYFMFYSLQADFFQKQVELGWNYGTQQNIGMRTLEHLKVCCPPLAEQKLIVDFLDNKVSKINDILIDLNNQVAILQKYKKSLITETVTKGLNSDVKMKDSGIEWIGEIPENWEIKRLKYLLKPNCINLRVGPFGSSLSGDDFKDEGYWVYNQRCVLDNNFIENDTFVDELKYKQLSAFKVFPNDILITTRGTIGKVAVVPEYAKEGILHPCLIKMVVNDKILLNDIVKYIFNESYIIHEQIFRSSNATTIEVIYSYTLKDLFIPVIPMEEQKEIINFLNKKCAQIDAIMKDKQTQIEKMESYKKSLIYEYVTGKKRVKGAEI